MNQESLWCPRTVSGKWIWTPPPAAADVAVEQLRIARLKRTSSTHVFVCPRLMYPRWRRQLNKVADLVVVAPAGKCFWTNDLHEPLVIALCFPFIRHQPWQLRKAPAILGVGRLLQKMWKNEEGDQRAILQKLCCCTWKLDSMPECLVREVLRGSCHYLLSQGRTRKQQRSGVEEED